MAQASKTYVVECYVPDVDDLVVQRSADATAGQVRRLGRSTGDVEYLGALLMSVDEVVLHAFRAADPELVRQVSLAAGLRFERILESVEVLPASLVRPGHAVATESQPLLSTIPARGSGVPDLGDRRGAFGVRRRRPAP